MKIVRLFASSSFLLHFFVVSSIITPAKANPLKSKTNVLVLGETHAGKTTIINKSCRSSRPVSVSGQAQSQPTTTQSCGSIDFTDSIGFFGFQNQSYESIDILRSFVDLISSGRVNAVAFVWSSKETVRNAHIEETIGILQQIAPGIPMVIVCNMFHSLISGVPAALAHKFNLPLLRVSATDTSQLVSWATDLTPKRYSIVSNYENLLGKDSQTLLEKFQEVRDSEMALCADIIELINNSRKRFNTIQVPDESSCNRNCEVRHRYCSTRMIFCVDYNSYTTIDQNCVRLVQKCKDSLVERNAEKKALEHEISELEETLPTACGKP